MIMSLKRSLLLSINVLVFAAAKAQITNTESVRSGEGGDGDNAFTPNAEGVSESQANSPDEERDKLILEGHLKSAANDSSGVNLSKDAGDETGLRNIMERDDKIKDFLRQLTMREWCHDLYFKGSETFLESEMLFHIFKDYDSNGDVHLDGIEMTKIIMDLDWRRGLFTTIPDSHFTDIIDPIFVNYDLDDDGELSYPEFRKLFEM